MAWPEWRDAKGRYRLSTGREFSAHLGILGLGPGDDLYAGYDDGVGYIYSPGETDDTPAPEDEWDEAEFTPEERREIAAMMIERWRRWGMFPSAERQEKRGVSWNVGNAGEAVVLHFDRSVAWLALSPEGAKALASALDLHARPKADAP